MIRQVGLGVSILLFSLNVYGNEVGDYDAISEVRVEEVFEAHPPMLLLADDVSANHSVDYSSVDWSEIINYGKQLWKIVIDNKPVVHVETPVAHAMPRGLRNWDELDGWKAPLTKTYKVSYLNGFRKEVVQFRFRIQYTYNGGRSGHGRYLANVTVMPATLNVSWGYTFNAEVQIGQPVNLGTARNPHAGLELNLAWAVKTVLKESRNSMHFFVQGDGTLKTAD